MQGVSLIDVLARLAVIEGSYKLIWPRHRLFVTEGFVCPVKLCFGTSLPS